MSDDEDIPSLVEVQPEGTGVDSDEFDFPRVPITIVTGSSPSHDIGKQLS